jgi:hypothetical protein
MLAPLVGEQRSDEVWAARVDFPGGPERTTEAQLGTSFLFLFISLFNFNLHLQFEFKFEFRGKLVFKLNVPLEHDMI